MDDDEITDLKLKINQFLWENAPKNLTLDDAENIACKFLALLRPDDYSLDDSCGPQLPLEPSPKDALEAEKEERRQHALRRTTNR